MFTCKDSIDRLLNYLDGDLSDEAREQLAEHFGGCQPCTDFLATYMATPQVCRAALAKKMPEDFARKLTSYLRTHIAEKTAK